MRNSIGKQKINTNEKVLPIDQFGPVIKFAVYIRYCNSNVIITVFK